MSALTPLRGLPGHPLHAALSDLVVGMFVLATGLACVGYIGWVTEPAGKAAWLAIVSGLAAATVTATTGLIDWLFIPRGSGAWKTATVHMLVMVTTVVLYALAAWRQWFGYLHGTVTTSGLALVCVGLATLLLGGFLGGSVVFVHGMRVLRLLPPQESQAQASAAARAGKQRA
jgi:uncharacterized membrane protein